MSLVVTPPRARTLTSDAPALEEAPSGYPCRDADPDTTPRPALARDESPAETVLDAWASPWHACAECCLPRDLCNCPTTSCEE
jgi:hypothetical protein